MSLQTLTNGLVAITLIEMMLAIGLGVTFAELAAVIRNRSLLLRAAIANYVCVPALTIVLLLSFQSQPMVAAGFLILAVCPGAPFSPPCAAIARGNVSASVGIMVLLAGSSAILAPALLGILLPWMSEGREVKVDAAKIVISLFATQLVPLFIGLVIRHLRPRLATRLEKPAKQVNSILSLITFGVIIVVQFPALTKIRLVGFGGMLALLVGSLAFGWILGGPGQALRRAMSLTTSLRNVGVGLVIATQNFAATPAVMAVAAYGIIEIIGSIMVAVWWRRTTPGS